MKSFWIYTYEKRLFYWNSVVSWSGHILPNWVQFRSDDSSVQVQWQLLIMSEAKLSSQECALSEVKEDKDDDESSNMVEDYLKFQK